MEFTEIMGKFKAELESPENLQHLKRGERWLYSIDGDKIHVGADLEQVGIGEADLWPHPALSSDMHKVVENVHAWLQGQMEKWVAQQGDRKLTAEECKEQLNQLFEDGYQHAWIKSNVESLPWTYLAVLLADGGYVQPDFR